MTKLITLTDVIQIDPNTELMKLKKKDKFKLIDSYLQNADSEAKRGLVITFNLSHSGRRINNRIYTPQGQRDGLSTWLEPYPKPIIRNHDNNADPLGRFSNVRWESIKDQSMKFFRRTNDFVSFMDAFESNVPKRIYNALRDNNLLLNKKWPGVGTLVADAQILDESAIEKFLDGRYLTFSAGSSTDRYVCGVCDSDWAQGDICDHRPGQITEDGEAVAFVTGIFAGREGSVLTMPADDLSQIIAMRMSDSIIGSLSLDKSNFTIDASNISLTDAIFDTGETVMTKDSNVVAVSDELENSDPRDIARAISDKTFGEDALQNLNDALDGETHLERSKLIRIHDALHSVHDYSIKWGDESHMQAIPTDVFKLHSRLHGIADDKGFRDSLVNGLLDEYDAKGEPSDQHKSERAKAKSSEASTSEASTSEMSTSEMSTDEEIVSSEEVVVEDKVEADPMQIALDSIISRLDALEAKTHEEVSEEVVEDSEQDVETNTEDEEEEKEEAIEDSKNVEAVESNDSTKTSMLLQDLVEALKKVDELKETVKTLEQKLADSSDGCGSIPDESTSVLGTVDTDTSDLSLNDQTIENPSVNSSENNQAKKLGSFEDKILSTYRSILDEQGDLAANYYIARKKQFGYLPRNFDPKKLG